jgi:hypothetical protein
VLPHQVNVPVCQCRFTHWYGIPFGTAWNISGNRGPAGGLVPMSPPARSRRPARQYDDVQLPVRVPTAP